MRLRTLAIVVAVVGVIAFFVSGFHNEFSGFPSAVSDGAWLVFLLAVLVEISLGITTLIRHTRREHARTGA